MDDLALYQRQLNRELGQRTEARDRLKRNTLKAEQKGYASSAVYNQKILKDSTAKIGNRLEKRLHHLRRGNAGVDAVIIDKHLKDTDKNVIALLTMKVAMDVLGKESKPKFVELSIAIGRAIETELRLNHYHKEDPELYRRVETGFHRSTGTRQKDTVFKIRFNAEGLEWHRWSNSTAHKIGAWCLDAIGEETGWLTKETIVVGKRSKRSIIRYSQEFLNLKANLLEQAEGLAFLSWPMICKPLIWSNEDLGGYITEAIHRMHPLVRQKGGLQHIKQGDIPIQTLNNIDNVAFRINQPVFQVLDWALTTKQTIGKFRVEEAKPDPNPPSQDCTPEELKAYKREKRRIKDNNAQIEQKNWRSIELHYVANKFKDEKAIYFPHSFGYRGRLYSQTTSLSPQGTDTEKALLYFVDEGPVNEYWLAWTVATTKGLDKKTHQERVNWTRENIETITAIGSDPIGSYDFWKDADEPWCHLAACIEYFLCCISCTKSLSGLPCGQDATGSGIQHLSAMTLDAESALKCNVLPTQIPSDCYKIVADNSLQYISDQSVHKYITRKITKKVCMCIPYGLTKTSARTYIREALKETTIDLSVKGRLTEITEAIYDKSVPEIFAGPVEVMKWIQKAAKEIISQTDTITWTTASGFNVVQNLRLSLSSRVQTRLMGAVVSCQVGERWGGPDVKHHVSALAPNLTHSNDSSLIHLTFAYWDDKPFQSIHDCILVRSCDMDEAKDAIRMHFVEIYKAPVLEDWANQVGVEVPQGLIKNTLDLEKVNDSDYFFC